MSVIRGIHHIGIHAKNFEKMRDFYCEAFGFEQIGDEQSWSPNPFGDALTGVENAAGRLVLMRSNNFFLELFEWYSPAPRDAGPASPNDIGYTHFAVEVTDIEYEFERLKSLGMTFTADAPGDLGVVKSIYGRDPEGNVIELQEMVSGLPSSFDTICPRANQPTDAA